MSAKRPHLMLRNAFWLLTNGISGYPGFSSWAERHPAEPQISENQENQTPNSTAEKGGASRQQFLCVDGGKNKIKEVDQIISNVAAFIENNDVRKQTF